MSENRPNEEAAFREPEQETNAGPDGWRDETAPRAESLGRFLQKHLTALSGGEPTKYDSISKLHFSGTNRKVFDKIAQGTAHITRINVFYQNGKAEQIHIVFDSEGTGQNIDVYLRVKALDDYLAAEAQS